MIALVVLAAGAALVLVILAWSLCRVAATADRQPVQARCARCDQPVPPRRGTPLLWCSEACAFLWLEEAS